MFRHARSLLFALVAALPTLSPLASTEAEAQRMIFRPGGGGWHGGGWHGGGWAGGGWNGGWRRPGWRGGWAGPGWRGGGWNGGWRGPGWRGGWAGSGWRGGGCGWGGCWGGGGWGWGGPFAVGLGGGLLGAALLAPGYGYNVPYGPPTYAIPYRSSCYWSRQRVYDYRGRLIGRHVQICH